MANPASFCVIRSFYRKIVVLIKIRTQIIKLEGEHADHHILPLLILLSYFCLAFYLYSKFTTLNSLFLKLSRSQQQQEAEADIPEGIRPPPTAYS